MSNCTLQLKLITRPYHEAELEHLFQCSERMYNIMVRHARDCVAALYDDETYKELLSAYGKCPNSEDGKKEKEAIGNQLKEKVRSHGLSEYQFHAYIVKMKNESFHKVIDANTAQKIASRVWRATSEVIYRGGKSILFKEPGTLTSIEGKTNESGICFNPSTMQMRIGRKFIVPVKIRENDTHAKELLKRKICYCTIIRRPFKNGYKYFLQLMIEGIPPEKVELGTGNVGIDMGVSTLAAIGDNGGLLIAHGNNMSKENNQTIDKYNKEIMRLSKKLERQRRLNNPQNYNNDGTLKRGAKEWKETNGYRKTLFALRDVYRKKSKFIEQQHHIGAKRLLLLGDRFITEPMKWTALKRRSKKTEKSNRAKMVKKKDGSVVIFRRFKKKKRFGKSLDDHSPGKMEEIINQKLGYINKKMEYVNLPTYKASQYNPETNEYIKCDLKTRRKEMFGQQIQRDLLSAFLLQNPTSDLRDIDVSVVQGKTNQFIKIHNNVIESIKDIPNLPACMGSGQYR